MGASKGLWLLLSIVVVLGRTQGPTDTRLVTAALSAMSGGLGGCPGKILVKPMASEVFVGVDFFRGRCVAEHGDTLHSLMGIDTSGIPYLLDSPSSFRFLLKRHRPYLTSIPATVRYAGLALEMEGEARDGAHFEDDNVPPAVARACAATIADSRTAPTKLSGGKIRLTLFGTAKRRASGYAVTVSRDGSVIYVRHDCWRVPPPTH